TLRFIPRREALAAMVRRVPGLATMPYNPLPDRLIVTSSDAQGAARVAAEATRLPGVHFALSDNDQVRQPAGSSSPSGSPTARTVIASGAWDGHAWTLKAGDDSSGRLCLLISIDMKFTTVAPPLQPNCSGAPRTRPPPSAPAHFPFGFGGFQGLYACPLAY